MAEKKPDSEKEPIDDTKKPAPGAEPADDKEPKPPVNPVKDELEKGKKPPQKRSKREVLEYNINRLKRDLEALPAGEEPVDDEEEELDDDQPVTVGMLKKKEVAAAKNTAKSLADERVEDADERELVKQYLDTRIVPSGNSEKDFRDALALVNSVKNGQVIEEITRKRDPQRQRSGSGAPGNHEQAFEPTSYERALMGPPYNLSKDDILKVREKEAASAR